MKIGVGRKDRPDQVSFKSINSTNVEINDQGLLKKDLIISDHGCTFLSKDI